MKNVRAILFSNNCMFTPKDIEHLFLISATTQFILSFAAGTFP